MRVLVLGAAGMLGHKVVQGLTPAYPDTWWTLRGKMSDPALDPVPQLRGAHAIEGVDALDLGQLDGLLQRLRPDAVINCVGIVKQREEARAAVPSIAINSLLPHWLADRLANWHGRLIHFSTDCVFSGRRGQYTEGDASDADDLYGRSKSLGEVDAPNTVTLRTSMIGRELRNHTALLDWFLGQIGGRVRGFRRVWWSGFTTGELARVVLMLLREAPEVHGVFQLSAGRISKYDLLHRLRDAYGLQIEIEPDDTVFCDRSLVSGRFEAATGYQSPSYDDMIRELVADPTSYPTLVA